MPALRWFGRRWCVASDDLPLPATLGLMVHLVWSCVLLVALVNISVTRSCTDAALFTTFMAELLACFLAGAVVFGLLVWHSSRGSLHEVHKRRWVPILLYLLLFDYALLMAACIYGTVAILTHVPSCLGKDELSWLAVSITRWVVMASWGVVAALIVGIMLSFNVFHDYRDERSWQANCRCMAMCFCCQPEALKSAEDGRPPPLLRVASFFASVFAHIDMTVSDVVACLLLLGLENSTSTSSNAPGSPSSRSSGQPLLASSRASSAEEPQPPHQPVRVEDLEEALHYHKYALAAYGWMMYVWTHRGKADKCCHLLCFYGCFGCCLPSARDRPHLPRRLRYQDPDLTRARRRRSGSGSGISNANGNGAASTASGNGVAISVGGSGAASTVNGNGAAGTVSWNWGPARSGSFGPHLPSYVHQLHRSTILETSGLKPRHLMYVNYVNLLAGRLPYFIALDEAKRCVVVAIRGSLSVEDCLTDVMCEPEVMDESWLNGADSASSAPVHVLVEGGEQLREQAMLAHHGMMKCARAILADLDRHNILRALLDNDEEAAEKLGHAYKRDCRGWQLVLVGHSLGSGVAALLSFPLRVRYPNIKCWLFAPPGGVLSPAAAARLDNIAVSLIHATDIVPRLSLHSVERLRDRMVEVGVRCRYSKAVLLLHALVGLPLKVEKLFAPLPDVSLQVQEVHQQFFQSVAISRQLLGRYQPARSFVTPGRLLYLERLIEKALDGTSSTHYVPRWLSRQELSAQNLLVTPTAFTDHFPDTQIQNLAATVDRLQGRTARSRSNLLQTMFTFFSSAQRGSHSSREGSFRSKANFQVATAGNGSGSNLGSSCSGDASYLGHSASTGNLSSFGTDGSGVKLLGSHSHSCRNSHTPGSSNGSSILSQGSSSASSELHGSFSQLHSSSSVDGNLREAGSGGSQNKPLSGSSRSTGNLSKTGLDGMPPRAPVGSGAGARGSTTRESRFARLRIGAGAARGEAARAGRNEGEEREWNGERAPGGVLRRFSRTSGGVAEAELQLSLSVVSGEGANAGLGAGPASGTVAGDATGLVHSTVGVKAIAGTLESRTGPVAGC